MIQLKDCPNIKTFEAFYKCYRHLFNKKSTMVSISGGADSDVMLDLIYKIIKSEGLNFENFKFVFFNTGIEMQATLNQIKYLKKHYAIHIEEIRAFEPVPLACKKYGVPFISKFISQMIKRLQNINFDFKNDGNLDYSLLIKKYPKTIGAFTWWCNKYPSQKGKQSIFNICTNKLLKEFLIANPPCFKISDDCCNGAKKDTSKKYEKENCIDCKCLGLRQAEGGQRSSSIKSCYDDANNRTKYAKYRPIWWFTDKDRLQYEEYFKIKHSDCYTIYGFKRTGCAGCPFNSKFERDLLVLKEYEPKLYNAVNNIFKDSYEYTRKYRNFKQGLNYE